ncbi:MAG: Mn(2(+))/Fe(2(+)): H(+) symporter MntH [Candidatus Westeberhardia cardiocondylae]|nr:Mn(2(+))/Fe(2(+)): H(+) symporter MntH [Candidatus Westeberhardia cardiocondylae]
MIYSQLDNNYNKMKRKIKFSLLGPAFIAAIGYIDPGNFATNIQAGANFGYKLLWVVTWANIMATVIQLLSAKLGIATRKNLAEHIRDRFPKPIVWAYWIQAEVIAMATDLAEFIGAAIGFKMLLGISLLQGAMITGIFTFLILMLQNYGQKPLELVVGGLLIFVAFAYVIELFYSRPDFCKLSIGILVPTLPNSEAVFLSSGILGATIMPHVIYLHSSLTQQCKGTRMEQYASTKLDVAIAMTIASFVNLAMLATSAATFHFSGYTHIADLDEAYLTLSPLLDCTASTVFGLSLIASGLSSTVVGTMAGQVVMQGFIRFRIPLFLRRIITIFPSFMVILFGLNPTRILILSQMLLSFGIALVLIPLLMFTNNRLLMQDMVNTFFVKVLGWVIVVVVIELNIYLLIRTFLE